MYENAIIITDNQTIATPDWAKGIYILKAFTEKGNLSVFKFSFPDGHGRYLYPYSFL